MLLVTRVAVVTHDVRLHGAAAGRSTKQSSTHAEDVKLHTGTAPPDGNEGQEHYYQYSLALSFIPPVERRVAGRDRVRIQKVRMKQFSRCIKRSMVAKQAGVNDLMLS